MVKIWQESWSSSFKKMFIVASSCVTTASFIQRKRYNFSSTFDNFNIIIFLINYVCADSTDTKWSIWIKMNLDKGLRFRNINPNEVVIPHSRQAPLSLPSYYRFYHFLLILKDFFINSKALQLFRKYSLLIYLPRVAHNESTRVTHRVLHLPTIRDNSAINVCQWYPSVELGPSIIDWQNYVDTYYMFAILYQD